jgi:hypothetical protein
MASGAPYLKVMQCHCTPDDSRAKVCVGFAFKVGRKSVGFRLAEAMGLIDPVEDDEDLMDTVEDVIGKHNRGGADGSEDVQDLPAQGRER